MSFMRKRQLLAAAGLASVAWSVSSSATVPNKLIEQGRLLDGNGAPVVGTVAITLTIYDAATGGSILWTEPQVVTLDDGYFSMKLGEAASLPATLWDGSERYLGVQVGSGSVAKYQGDILYGLSVQGGNVHPGNIVDNTKLQCSVCSATAAACVMLEGASSCPSGYTAQYSGYTYGAHYTHNSMGHVCINDAAYDGTLGNTGTDNGAYVYPTSAYATVGTTVPQGNYVSCMVCCTSS
jgi:hypothetical protein